MTVKESQKSTFGKFLNEKAKGEQFKTRIFSIKDLDVPTYNFLLSNRTKTADLRDMRKVAMNDSDLFCDGRCDSESVFGILEALSQLSEAQAALVGSSNSFQEMTARGQISKASFKT